MAVGAGLCRLFDRFRYVLMSVVINCRKTIVLCVKLSPRDVPVKLEKRLVKRAVIEKFNGGSLG